MWRSTLCLLCITALGLIPTNSIEEIKFKNKELLVFIEQEIVTDVIPNIPKRILIVNFKNNTNVEMGNVLTPTQTKEQPEIKWPSHPKRFYTACMIDPDVPSRKKPTDREWNHWLVVNIPGKNIKKGEVLAEYIGPKPSENTGFHRYVILVYKQPSKLVFDELHLTNTSANHREQFSISDFALKYSLEKPFAANFFFAKYDEYSTKIDLELGI